MEARARLAGVADMEVSVGGREGEHLGPVHQRTRLEADLTR